MLKIKVRNTQNSPIPKYFANFTVLVGQYTSGALNGGHHASPSSTPHSTAHTGWARQVFLTPPVVPSHGAPEVSRGASISSMEISKHYKAEFYFPQGVNC